MNYMTAAKFTVVLDMSAARRQFKMNTLDALQSMQTNGLIAFSNFQLLERLSVRFMMELYTKQAENKVCILSNPLF